MSKATGNAGPSLGELHTALWSSYIRSPDPKSLGRAGAPLPVGELVRVLRARAADVPRPLLVLALSNLLAAKPNGATPPTLETLVADVVGSSVDDARDLYGGRIEPLPLLTELYGILDCGWRKLANLPAGSYGARLELCVQSAFEDTRKILDPRVWFRRCGLFWGPVEAEAGEPPSVTPGERSFVQPLRLPGPGGGAEAPATVYATFVVDAAVATNDFRVDSALFEECSGVMRAEKERGRPGATRVTHEKRVRYAAGKGSDFGEQTLAYWIQAETLCLLLPPETAAGEEPLA